MALTSLQLYLFRQREDNERVSAWRPEHGGCEPFDPSAPPRRHGDVLPAINDVSRWVAVVAASRLELPQQLAGLRIEGVELPRRFADEHEVAACGQHRRADRLVVAIPPPLLARGCIEGLHEPLCVLDVDVDARSPVRNALLELPVPQRDLRTDI